MKKILVMLICICTIIVSIPASASAQTEAYTGEFRKISTDGTWKVNSVKPKNASESSVLITLLARDVIDSVNYFATGMCSIDNFNPEKAEVTVYAYEGMEDGSNYSETHELNVKYNEPDKKITAAVAQIAEKLVYPYSASYKNYYSLEDMNLINYYYYTAGDLDITRPGISIDLPMNFAEDIRQIAGGANVYVKMDVREGGSNIFQDALFLHDVTGPVGFYYDGALCYVTDESKAMTFAAKHVLYVPDDADNYMEAAKERLASYLGEGNFSISLGGTLESLSYEDDFGNIIDFNDFDWFDENKLADDNYYKITLNGNEFEFLLYKVPAEEIQEPTFMGMDIESGIIVYSDDTTIPLDAAVSTEKVQSDEIEKAVKTDEYVAYDISLFSRCAGRSIDKSTSDDFNVHIPIPADMEGEDLAVYYVDDSGNSTKYDVNIENGYAVFDTDHFSTYVLAENVADTPDGNGSAASGNDQATPDNNGANDDKADNSNIPATNDSRNAALWLVIMAISAAIFTVIKARQRNLYSTAKRDK